MDEWVYECKKWDLEFRKKMYEDMIDSNKTMWKMDVLLMVMEVFVVIFCTTWGVLQFIEGHYLFAVLELVLVITNVCTSVLTVKRMIRNRKSTKSYKEKLEEIETEYLELLEKEGNGND